jgi:hypothetical protein
MMTIKDEIKRIRDLSDQAQRLMKLKRKVADDFDKGTLTHERLDMYIKERERILKEVKLNIRNKDAFF